MTDEQIKQMAERFLQWKLPANFHPDAGISFEPEFNVEWTAARGLPPDRHNPTGTNLWGYTEAVEMVRHMVAGLDEAHDATKAEFSDAAKKAIAEAYRGGDAGTKAISAILSRFILPEPVDPLVEAFKDLGEEYPDKTAERLRHILAKRGLTIQEQNP